MAYEGCKLRRFRKRAEQVRSFGTLLRLFSLLLLPISTPNAQLLRGPSTPIPAEYFGMHIHKAARAGEFMRTQGRQDANSAPTPWPGVPFRAWRLWDAGVTWSELEPVKGEWHFELLDKYADLARQHGVEMLLTLGQTPAWASSRPAEKQAYLPGNAAEPRSLEDWRVYVRTVATRYKGAIQAYEVWNEPNLKLFYTGTVGRMFDLTREAFTVLKSVDPSILVVSASSGADPRWLEQYLQAGAGKYIDIVGFHFYMPDGPEQLVYSAQRVKRAMADNGISAKPLWNTEAGWGRTPTAKFFTSDDQAAAYVARSYILNWAADISRFYWYAWDNFWWVTLNMTNPDRRTEKPAAQAYRTVQKWLVGAVMRSCEKTSAGTWQCELRRADINYRILWNPGGSSTVQTPSEWRVTTAMDLSGATRRLTNRQLTVNESPVLVQ